MIARELIALLKTLPADAEVLTWDPAMRELQAVEQVILADGDVAIGMEMAPEADRVEVLWAAHDVALKGLVKARWIRTEKRVG